MQLFHWRFHRYGSRNRVSGLVLVGHIGKLIKVAGGIMNTHSKWADCRMELFAAAALLAGLPEGKARAFLDCVTTDDALAQCTGEERGLIMDAVMDKIEKYLSYRAPVEMETAAVVFSNVYGTLERPVRRMQYCKKAGGRAWQEDCMVWAWVREIRSS